MKQWRRELAATWPETFAILDNPTTQALPSNTYVTSLYLSLNSRKENFLSMLFLLVNPTRNCDVHNWLQRDLRHLPVWTTLPHKTLPSNTYVTSLYLSLNYLTWLIYADFCNMTLLKPENKFAPLAPTSDNLCELKSFLNSRVVY